MKLSLFSKKHKVINEQVGECDYYFGLSRASWLVLPRIALQSMSLDWQSRFFKMVRELEETLEYPEGYTGNFGVTMRDHGKYVKSVMPDYRRLTLPMKQREDVSNSKH